MNHKRYTLCCDSGDLYGWVLKNTNVRFERNNDYTRSIFLNVDESEVQIDFVFKQSTRGLFTATTKDFLKNTAGTPDYILFHGSTPLVCIEDSKTAPVGNALIQRMDKLFPLLIDNEIDCPVLYVGPKSGMDKSNNQMRSWTQSWFYKSFVKNRQDAFVLLENNEDVCQSVFDKICEVVSSHVSGTTSIKKTTTIDEMQALHDAMKKSIRTYDGDTFRGKLFKPNGTDAHPIQSTLMTICEVRNKLGLSPVEILFYNSEHEQKYGRSNSTRVQRIRRLNLRLNLNQRRA
jgi:hypothetical protein